MTPPAPSRARGWARRGVTVLAVAGASWAALWLMDFDPRPLGWLLLVGVGCGVVWLVVDTLETAEGEWHSELAASAPRPPESSPDLRLLTNHRASSAPSGALRDRLEMLARERDPGLRDDRLRALVGDLTSGPPRRLQPTQIDAVLTRIEELRDPR